MGDVKTAIENAVAYVTDHPDEARYTDSVATARLGDALRVEVSGPGGESTTTDMPTGVGGQGQSPSPGWLLRAAVAACDAALIGMRAAQQGVTLSKVEVEVDSESDDRGILGIDASVPSGPLSMRVRVRAEGSGASEDEVREVVEWAVAHCPVHDAVARAVETSLKIESV